MQTIQAFTLWSIETNCFGLAAAGLLYAESMRFDCNRKKSGRKKSTRKVCMLDSFWVRTELFFFAITKRNSSFHSFSPNSSLQSILLSVIAGQREWNKKYSSQYLFNPFRSFHFLPTKMDFELIIPIWISTRKNQI